MLLVPEFSFLVIWICNTETAKVFHLVYFEKANKKHIVTREVKREVDNLCLCSKFTFCFLHLLGDNTEGTKFLKFRMCLVDYFRFLKSFM